MSKRASIDIGSNSVLLLAAQMKGEEIKEILANESRVTGLGRDLDQNKVFLKEAEEETLQALREYRELCLSVGINPEEIVATATEASRIASNAPAFFARVKKDLGIDVKIINGKAEAFFSAKGILLDANLQERLAIMDIGGASTEFIVVEPPGEVAFSFSAPFGSVRATNWLKEGSWPKSFETAKETFKEEFKKINTPVLHCVAGTMTSLANMRLDNKNFVEEDVHGYVLLKKDIAEMFESFKDFTPSDFLNRFPFLGKRSNAIRGGLFLVKAICEAVPADKFKVSTYGLRYGALLAGEIQDEHLHK